ncbi:MAG TPA: hypothetical protein VFF67_00700 [Thermoplasmata archaeon]|nr:hypothetical protein [Thermoplasmata archaeon]
MRANSRGVGLRRGGLGGGVVLCLVSFLALAPGVPWSTHATLDRGPAVHLLEDPTGALALNVQPGTWTLEAGGRLTLTAAPTGLGPTCSLDWLQIAWSLPGISVNDGFLNASLGTSVTFAAFGGASGPATVSAVGAGVADCDGVPYSVAPAGTAVVSILPPLVLDGLQSGPNPAPVGQSVALAAVVHGGLPPYSLALDFGDGTHGSESVAEPGTVVVDHVYGAGRFSPTWNVTDALRSSDSASPIDPIVVASSLVVIVTGPSQVDAGVSATLAANVSGGVPPYVFTWSDLQGSAPSAPR